MHAKNKNIRWSLTFCPLACGLQSIAVKDIFKEFDVSGDRQLDYQEFCMFTMACVERQKKMVVVEETRNKRCLIF